MQEEWYPEGFIFHTEYRQNIRERRLIKSRDQDVSSQVQNWKGDDSVSDADENR